MGPGVDGGIVPDLRYLYFVGGANPVREQLRTGGVMVSIPQAR